MGSRFQRELSWIPVFNPQAERGRSGGGAGWKRLGEWRVCRLTSQGLVQTDHAELGKSMKSR